MYAHTHTSHTPQLCFSPLELGTIASIYTEQVLCIGRYCVGGVAMIFAVLNEHYLKS